MVQRFQLSHFSRSSRHEQHNDDRSNPACNHGVSLLNKVVNPAIKSAVNVSRWNKGPRRARVELRISNFFPFCLAFTIADV